MYGSAQLWWVFAHYNRDKLVDPIMDFIREQNSLTQDHRISKDCPMAQFSSTQDNVTAQVPLTGLITGLSI